MMEIPRLIYENYLKSPEGAIELEKLLAGEFSKSSLYNEKQPVRPFLPLFIKEKQHEELKKSSEQFGRLMDKTIKLVLEQKITGRYLRIYKTWWEWIKRENTIFREKHNITFARTKGVFDKKGKVKFFEFSADPKNLFLGEVLLEIYGKIDNLQYLLNKNNITFFNKAKNSFTRFLGKYFKETGFVRGKNTIAFIKFNNDYSWKLYERYFKSKGHKFYGVTPENFIFNGEFLEVDGNKIDLVILTDIENTKKIKPLVEAYLNGKVKLLDFLRASIASEKSLLAFMSDPRNHNFYTKKEKDFIKNHIPWTRVIRHEETTDIEGNKVDLVDYILNNQEKLVLKKSNSAIGGQIGPAYEMNSLDWKTLISWILTSKEYWIAQERVEFNLSERYILEDKEARLKKFYWCITPYLFNNKYQVCYGRISEEPVVDTEIIQLETLAGFQKNN